jgi:predicted amidohydrolase YtcJ
VLIARAEIDGIAPLDVRIADGRIAEIGRGLAHRAGETRIDAGGGALLPGLHDHHLHLFALAAAEASLRCGPPAVRDADAFAKALANAGGREGWIRGIGYHESVAGELDRTRLDALVPDRPARIQHRSGALWIVNSAGVESLGLDRGADARGVERAPDGRATGRLYRLDAWLRERIESGGPPPLDGVSRRLAAFGVTGVTDATATNGSGELEALVAAAQRGELCQRVVVMGSAQLPEATHPYVVRGAVKVLLDERDLPGFEELQETIADAHRRERPAAIHCVTRAELVLATAAFAAAGSRAGDRIEHAAVAPPEALPPLCELSLTVVTQPNFVRERGDAYLVDVEARDRPWLYRGRGLLEASVSLGGGTDAPFGDPDPWAAMRAAVDRNTEAGFALGPDEGLSPERALALFTSPASAPGDPPRPIAVRAPADLCLLDRPWSAARSELSSTLVTAAIRDGSIIWQRH